VITAGPTQEAIDRSFLSNRSREDGLCVAEAARPRCGRDLKPAGVDRLTKGARTISVRFCREMYEAVKVNLDDATRCDGGSRRGLSPGSVHQRKIRKP